MNLPRIFGKEKPVSFDQFRDMVRLAVRRQLPGARIENTENGFTIITDDKPNTCNLRSLYATYAKAPAKRVEIITHWMEKALAVQTAPVHSWDEARPLLRAAFINAPMLADARASLVREQDSLEAMPFAGELSVVVFRDLQGLAAIATVKDLEGWGVNLDTAMTEALNNMNMMSFPTVTNALTAGVASRRSGGGEEVGLVFEGDHLTATWLVLGRFRDYLGQRLEGDYVAAVPSANRLVAIRADEMGLITSIQQANRNYRTLPHALTSQCFHINAATTGGLVTVYQLGGTSEDRLDPNSRFAKSGAGAGPRPVMPLPGAAAPPRKPEPRDLNSWWGSTDEPKDPPPPDRKRR